MAEGRSQSRLTDNRPVSGRYELLCPRREFDPGLLGVGVVSDDRGVIARGLGQLAAVARLLFQRANNRAFWHGSNRKDIADGELCCKQYSLKCER